MRRLLPASDPGRSAPQTPAGVALYSHLLSHFLPSFPIPGSGQMRRQRSRSSPAFVSHRYRFPAFDTPTAPWSEQNAPGVTVFTAGGFVVGFGFGLVVVGAGFGFVVFGATSGLDVVFRDGVRDGLVGAALVAGCPFGVDVPRVGVGGWPAACSAAVVALLAGGSARIPMARNPPQQRARMPPTVMPMVFQGARFRAGGVGCQGCGLVGWCIGPLWRGCLWSSITRSVDRCLMIGVDGSLFGYRKAAACLCTAAAVDG